MSDRLWQLLQLRVLRQVEGLESFQIGECRFRQILEQVAAERMKG